MADTTNLDADAAIVAMLARRFPSAISLDPPRVVPLSISIFDDLCREMRLEGNEAIACQRALDWYQNRTPYQRAVALGKKRHSLWGKPVSDISIEDRNAARALLLKRKSWSGRFENIYRSRIGHVVRLEPADGSRRGNYDTRHAAWLERLRAAGFTDAEIEIIQRNRIDTDDLAETRRAVDSHMQG